MIVFSQKVAKSDPVVSLLSKLINPNLTRLLSMIFSQELAFSGFLATGSKQGCTGPLRQSGEVFCARYSEVTNKNEVPVSIFQTDIRIGFDRTGPLSIN